MKIGLRRGLVYTGRAPERGLVVRDPCRNCVEPTLESLCENAACISVNEEKENHKCYG